MKIWAALLFLALCACASKPAPTEYDLITKRPKPANDEARRQECAWIDTSLQRQKVLASYVAATATYAELALAHQDAAQRNMAVLQSRAQQISCNPAGAGGSFDECFARCTQYTQRSKEQCFDACNK
jgi:hypothetical protein